MSVFVVVVASTCDPQVALCVLKQSVCLVEVFLVHTSTVSRDASLL